MQPTIVLSASLLAMSLASSSLAASMSHPVTAPTADRQSFPATRIAGSLDITNRYGLAIFVKDNWSIKILRDGNRFIYSGGQDGKKGISLTNGKLIKSGGKHFYKWNNGGTIYQVTWQPADPEFARVQVFDPDGSEIFNKLMWTPPYD